MRLCEINSDSMVRAQQNFARTLDFNKILKVITSLVLKVGSVVLYYMQLTTLVLLYGSIYRVCRLTLSFLILRGNDNARPKFPFPAIFPVITFISNFVHFFSLSYPISLLEDHQRQLCEFQVLPRPLSDC